jgi:hypothetical protein
MYLKQTKNRNLGYYFSIYLSYELLINKFKYISFLFITYNTERKSFLRVRIAKRKAVAIELTYS